ncbi:MAG: hypothetical protein ACRDIU_08555, partial [Actinomycetota bacterium]
MKLSPAPVLIAMLLWASAAAPPAQAKSGPSPKYSATGADAVTADNKRLASCSPGGPCQAADPNPADPAAAVDSYTQDLYERPLTAGSRSVAPALDIVSGRVGSDDAYLYFRIDLFGIEEAGLPYTYGFELDYDDDPAGDLLAIIAGPLLKPKFAAAAVSAFWNENSNITGPNPGFPDGPGATPDGYERPVFQAGKNLAPDSPGGGDALVARISPRSPASIELAVRREFLKPMNQ